MFKESTSDCLDLMERWRLNHDIKTMSLLSALGD